MYTVSPVFLDRLYCGLIMVLSSASFFAPSISLMQEVLIKQIHKVSTIIISFADLKCCVD